MGRVLRDADIHPLLIWLVEQVVADVLVERGLRCAADHHLTDLVMVEALPPIGVCVIA